MASANGKTDSLPLVAAGVVGTVLAVLVINDYQKEQRNLERVRQREK